MACKYIINGKEYSESQVQRIALTASSLPSRNTEDPLRSIKTRSDEETIAVMKEQTLDRFVDIDLLTPMQEAAYVRMIASYVINRIGALKPDMQIGLNPKTVYEEVRGLFKNGKAKFDYLQSKITTKEQLKAQKANEQVLSKFPELKAITDPAQFEKITEEYETIIKNFDRFQEQVVMRLRYYGLTLKENKFAIQEADLEALRNKFNGENAEVQDNVFEVQDREIDESFTDGKQFTVNPRDKMSTRVKMFFYQIPAGEVNMFGIQEFVDYDKVIRDLLEAGSRVEDMSLANMTKYLEKKYKARPYLKHVVYALSKLQANRQTDLLNEILTFTNQAYQEQLLNKVTVKGKTTTSEIISSNRRSALKQIQGDWLERQKYAKIIIQSDTGQLIVNTKEVSRLQEKLVAAKQGDTEVKKKFVKTFLTSLGIEFNADMIEDMVVRADNGEFRERSANVDFNALFNDNSFFDFILKNYNQIPTGATEAILEDVNNGMKNQSKRFSKLAEIYYENAADVYESGGFTNGENKVIYPFVNRSFLENVKRNLKKPAYLKKVQKWAFSKGAEVIQKLRSKAADFSFDIKYMDSMKVESRGNDAVTRKNMSGREQMIDALHKHQNSGDIGAYNMFTLSNKTTTPVVMMTKFNISKSMVFLNKPGAAFIDTFTFKKEFKDELFRLAESEINRITEYVNLKDKSQVDIKNFDKGYTFFYLFPVLNRSDIDSLNTVKKKIYEGSTLSEQDKNVIKEVLTDSFKENIVNTWLTWKRNGIIEKSKEGDYSIPASNISYLNKDELRSLNGLQKTVYTLADLKLNYLRANINALQLFGSDPASYYKMPKTGVDKSKTFEQYTDQEKMNIVIATMDEFSKRAAMFIAPGLQGVWNWQDLNGNTVDRSSYYTITLNDVTVDTALFSGVDVTDAQEFITLQEHIDRMMSEGRIPVAIWQSITDKIEAGKGTMYRLSDKEKQIVLQPTKPVHVNTTDLGQFPRVDYVKSSTYPLIPEVIADSELNNLRVFMENNDIQSANFASAKKTGQPKSLAEVFNAETGDFVTPVEYTVQTLNREGLFTQQEIPYQKEEIANISQMNRTLFDGLSEVKDFSLNDDAKEFSGKEFKKLKEDVRVAQFMKAKKAFMKRFKIEDVPGGPVFSDKSELIKLLKEEAIKQNFSVNDINAIKLGKDGTFIFPVHLMARSEKFEGMMNSLVSKIVRLKNPGTSLVQVSGVGTKLKMEELSKGQKSDIIYTDNFDPKKGLQYLRKENGQVRGAQVIISRFLKDQEGNLIDLSKLVIEKDGMKILDPSKIDPKILQLVGSRIPNQGHASMLPIEIAGFLPEYMENTIIVPDGITKQMGSDFDVDKLYAYTSELNLKYKGQNANQGKTINRIETLSYTLDYDGEYTSLMNYSDAELNQMYRDIHWSVLTHPKTFSKITKSIDFPDINNEVALLESIGMYQTDPNMMPFDFMNQIQVFEDNKGGGVGTGIFASLGSFLSDNQDKTDNQGYGISLGRDDKEDGKIIRTLSPIKIKDTDGSVLELSSITKEGKTGSNESLRSKTDNNTMALSESVDNAKNKNLYRFNWHPNLMNALQGLIALSTEEGKIHDITFATRLFPQQILKDYARMLENGSDSFTEFSGDVKQNTITKIKDRYKNLISDAALEQYNQKKENAQPGEQVEEVFSAERLKQLLITQVALPVLREELTAQKITDNRRAEITQQLDDYYKAQLDILDLFTRLDEVGGELSTVIGASYIYTKGIGSSIFNITDNIRKLGKLASSTTFINLDLLAGSVKAGEGSATLISPKGEIGHSIQESLFFAQGLFKEIFPIHFSESFNAIVDRILGSANINKQTIGSSRYLKLHKQILGGVKAYMFSSAGTEIFDDAGEERQRLLMDTPDNPSLGTRIEKARINHPWLAENYFAKRLSVRGGLKLSDPKLVTYTSSHSEDIDELSNNKGFLELIFSGETELMDLAKDLVKYSFVTGNLSGPGSFYRFIPVEYLLSDEDFVQGVKQLEQETYSSEDRFVEQFIQNNPRMAKSLMEETYNTLSQKGKRKEGFSILKDSKIYEDLKVSPTIKEASADKSLKAKLPDFLSYYDYKNDQMLLYKRVGGLSALQYERINTLGTAKAGFSEYNTQADNMESVLFNNLTSAQKLGKVMTNADNVFSAFTGDLSQRVREIAMADVSTKFIGSVVPQAKTGTNYIDTAKELWIKSGKNSENYTAADVVMVVGNNAYTLAKDNKSLLSAEQLKEHFDTEYLPRLQKAMAAGSSFTVGQYSGMDEMVKSFLKAARFKEQKTSFGYSIFSPNASSLDNLVDQINENTLVDQINLDSLDEDALLDQINLDYMEDTSLENIDINQMQMPEEQVKIKSLQMQPDNIQKIKEGTKSITNRTEKLDSGEYKLPDGTLVYLTLLGKYKVEDTKVIAVGETQGAETMSLNTFAKMEGFSSAIDFINNNKYSKNFINGTQERFVYQITLADQLNEQSAQEQTGPDSYTNHSGGAVGADSMFDKIGKEFGQTNHVHYYYGNKTPLGNRELTQTELQEGIAEMKKAAVLLGKNPQKAETINLLARNWFQVKNSTQIIAIAPIADDMKTVEGGTGWAVAMGQVNGREVNVFNLKDNFWYKWNGTLFIRSEVPVLQKDFAGIGSRQDFGKMTKKSIQAIRDVYEKTFNQEQPATVIGLQEKFSRTSVQNDPDFIYLFTDNAQRTSGGNPIADESRYAAIYGEGKKYPGVTQAVIRGLNNAFPITTMVDDKRTQWSDDRFDEYKEIIDEEIAIIKQNLPGFKGIKFSAEMPFGKGQISNMQSTAPKIFEYMNQKLAEIGIDNTVSGPVAVNQQSAEKINIYASTSENAELSNFATRPFTVGGMTYKNVESAFQHTKLMFSDPITDQPSIIQSTNWSNLSGAQAKSLGRQFTGLDTKEWDQQSPAIMKTSLLESFKQNPDALQKLLATGNAELTHTQDKTRWGKEFPKLLMEVREELKGLPVPEVTITNDIEIGQYVKYQGETFIVTQINDNGTIQIYNPTKEGAQSKKSVASRNLEVLDTVAKSVTYKGVDYLVTPKNGIISLTSNKLMQWAENNGDRRAILELANGKGPTEESLADLFAAAGEISTEDMASVMNMVDTADVINMAEFADDMMPQAAIQQTSPVITLLGANEGNVKMSSVLSKLGASTKNPFYAQLIDIMTGRSTGVPEINILITENSDDPGMFTGNQIIINPTLAAKDNPDLSAQDNLENVLMHEIMHAFTVSTIQTFFDNPNTLSQRERVFATGLRNLYADTLKKLSNDPTHSAGIAKAMQAVGNPDDIDTMLTSKEKSLYYGMTNIYEFTSMVMTDPGFQQFMNEIIYEEKSNLSVFEQFKQLLARLLESLGKALGITVKDNSVLREGVNNIVGLLNSYQQLDLSSSVPDAPVDDMPLDLEEVQNNINDNSFDPYKINTPKGRFDVNDDQRIAIDRITEYLKKPVSDKFEDNVFLLYGAGGTGKTAVTGNAIVKAIQELDTRRQPNVGFAAVTHTAKSELRAAGNEGAMTLASMLGARPVFNDGVETYELISKDELQASGAALPQIFAVDWLVIDEASMLGGPAKEMLMQRIKEREGRPVKILFMGDHAQIPPVGEKPDMDGFAIDLRKNDTKSVKLTKIERTKNVDISELGMRFRRAVDFYNQKIEETGTSFKSGLRTDMLLSKEDLKTDTENIFFTDNQQNFIDRFVKLFEQDPLNARNAVMISYNNEVNPYTVNMTAQIRKQLFGQAAEQMFIPGDAVALKATITAKNQNGKDVEIATNERVILQNISASQKTVKVGKGRYARFITVPVNMLSAITKDGESVRFSTMDKGWAAAFTYTNYDKVKKGYLMPDGEFIRYGESLDLKSEFPEIYHAYIISAHKVQGQTYNYSFVLENNIRKFVTVNDSNGQPILTPKAYAQLAYTAISRAREKVYILTDKVSKEKGTFVEPVVTPIQLKSIATVTPFQNMYELEKQCQ